jgi:hypothetical protein
MGLVSAYFSKVLTCVQEKATLGNLNRIRFYKRYWISLGKWNSKYGVSMDVKQL